MKIQSFLISFSKHTICPVLSLVAVLTGCSVDEYNHHDETVSEVRFVTNDSCHSATRSTQNGFFEKGDTIGVFAFVRSDNDKVADTSITPDAVNRKWVWDGTQFLPATDADRIFFSAGRKMDFYVYHPYDATVTGIHNWQFAVPANQSTLSGFQKADLLTAVNNSGVYGTAVTLNFKHRLAVIRLQTESLSGIRGATLHGVHSEVSLNPANGSRQTSGKPTDLQMLNRGVRNGLVTFEVCLPIQPVPTSGLKLTLDRTGGDIPILMSTGTLREGQVTTLPVTLMKTLTLTAGAGGSVFGAGTYPYGTVLTLQAIPHKANGDTRYSFVRWSDGVTTSVRSMTLTKDMSLTAVFQSEEWRYSLSANVSGLNFSSRADSRTLGISSIRTCYVNGTATATQTVAWSADISGSGAGAFSLSGTTVSAAENPTTSPRTATLTIRQTGGETASVALEQAGKLDVAVDIE